MPLEIVPKIKINEPKEIRQESFIQKTFENERLKGYYEDERNIGYKIHYKRIHSFSESLILRATAVHFFLNEVILNRPTIT